MLFMPSVRDDFDLFDDVFDTPMFGMEPVMKTDITEKDGKYVMETDLPGFSKEDIRISLKDGNLTVEAEHHSDDDKKDKDGRVIRRERYSGSYSRTFYVGETVKESDIHAEFRDGKLTLELPKEEEKPAVEDRHYIAIE